jgi:DNA replication licensing factor MCM5
MFIVRDTRDTERDRMIARHVVKVHVTAQDHMGDEGGEGGGGGGDGAGGGGGGREVDLATMKKYIAYARAKCAPVVTAEAAELLAGEYADIRQQAEGTARAAQALNAGKEGTNVGSVVPITVRQLEALVRITEAVAKASLSRDAGPEHVKEALSLFKKSTLAAAQKGNGVGDVLSPDMMARVKACEQRILKVVGPGQTLPVSHVKSQLRANGFDEGAINAALRVMDSREEIRLVDERKMVRRLR